MKYLIKIISFCILCMLFAMCDDMYSIHQKYLDEGEIVYLGKPTIQDVRGGDERVQLVWKITFDPKVEKCCIYWNDRQDSIEVQPDYTDTVMRKIIPLPEGSYIFEMRTKGKDNLSSLTDVHTGNSYGEIYKNGLYNRKLRSQSVENGVLTMTWGVEDNCSGLELEYINNVGEKKEIFLKGDETQLILSDFTPGEEFKYRSLYVPDKNALDTIPTKQESKLFPSIP